MTKERISVLPVSEGVGIPRKPAGAVSHSTALRGCGTLEPDLSSVAMGTPRVSPRS